MKKPIHILEILGNVVIILVLLGTTTTQNFTAYLSPVVVTTAITLAAVVFALMILSVCRLAGKSNYPLLTIAGTILVTIGGTIAFVVPEYFSQMISLPVPFWYKVSWYTLPAIVLEGGIMTLFIVMLEKGYVATFKPRERFLITCAFLVYLTGTVAVNFLVLNQRIDVASHIEWMRGISIFLLAICGFVGISKRYRTQ